MKHSNLSGHELEGQYRQVNLSLHSWESCTTKHNDLRKEDSVASSTDTQHAYVLNNNAPTLCGVFGVAFALLVSIVCAYVMWATNIYSDLIQQNLVLRNNTLRYDMWRHTPVQTFLRVYVFNYTNVKEFEDGTDEKLKLEELGPYTYKETIDRVNIVFNSNGTVSYQEKKTYVFAPELSSGGQYDSIMVPNMPYMAAIAWTKDSYYFPRLALSVALNKMHAEPMLRVPLDDLLWGYDDQLAYVARQILQFQHDVPFSKFGIMASKNGTQPDVLTIHTGSKNLAKLGQISRFNGEGELKHWKTEECNRIDGSDGSIFPPGRVHTDSTVYLYTKDMCRRLPLVFDRQYRDANLIKVLRFHVPSNVFTSGVFNVSPCAFNAPVYSSLPHFLYGEDSLFSNFEGLKPNVRNHESFAEIEPEFGVPITGVSRIQLNVQVKRYAGITMPSAYTNGLIMPVVWMEFGSKEMPQEMSFFIRNLLFLIQSTRILLSYGSLILAVASLILLLRMVFSRFEHIKEQEILARTLTTSARVPLVHKS